MSTFKHFILCYINYKYFYILKKIVNSFKFLFFSLRFLKQYVLVLINSFSSTYILLKYIIIRLINFYKIITIREKSKRVFTLCIT